MRRHQLLSGVRIGVIAIVLQFSAGTAHGVSIKMLTCAREAATKANNVASAVCKAQAGSRSSEAGAIYLVTLSAEELRGGTREVIRLAEQEARRQGLCHGGIEVVAEPARVGTAGRMEMAVRCSARKSR